MASGPARDTCTWSKLALLGSSIAAEIITSEGW